MGHFAILIWIKIRHITKKKELSLQWVKTHSVLMKGSMTYHFRKYPLLYIASQDFLCSMSFPIHVIVNMGGGVEKNCD